jgi:hypothetical protein
MLMLGKILSVRKESRLRNVNDKNKKGAKKSAPFSLPH